MLRVLTLTAKICYRRGNHAHLWMRKAPSLRHNNGSIQIRVRVNGVDHRIHRLGRWNDPRAVAKASAISAQIWSDYQAGELDITLRKYQSQEAPLNKDLLRSLQVMAERQPYGRVLHAFRVVQRYRRPLNTHSDVAAFVRWMEEEGLRASTRRSILGICRSINSNHEGLNSVKIKVPVRSVQHEVLSRFEVQKVIADLKSNESWYFPCFSLWINTGLRNSEIIGLTWDSIHWHEGELLISKTLRRNGNSNHRRVWSQTKTGQSRIVPLNKNILNGLSAHREKMSDLGVNTKIGLVFVSPRSYGNLYDGLLDKVWKRSQRRAGIVPRRLYAIRHTFLSHSLALGNSPADLASMAGHSTEELLKTYAKPTGNLKFVNWNQI